jgi:hypothetical protein
MSGRVLPNLSLSGISGWEALAVTRGSIALLEFFSFSPNPYLNSRNTHITTILHNGQDSAHGALDTIPTPPSHIQKPAIIDIEYLHSLLHNVIDHRQSAARHPLGIVDTTTTRDWSGSRSTHILTA